MPTGVHLKGGTVDLRRFQKRSGELLADAEIIGRPAKTGVVRDIALTQRNLDKALVVDQVAIGAAGRLRLRHQLALVPWKDVEELFSFDATAGELAKLRGLHKADAARRIGALPKARRAQIAAELDAQRLADVMEELPEGQQVEIIGGLETEEAIAVLEEMEVDDAIDLLKELPVSAREQYLAVMEDDDAARLRVLLQYREDTAGGMMTPEPIVVSPDTPIAEVIAIARDTDLPPALANRVYVTDAPTSPPTGRYHGTVTLQRLLHEPPSHTVGDSLSPQIPTVLATTPELEVAELLARYDLLSVPVVDQAGRLLGAVTVDDVVLRLVERARELDR